MKLETDPRVTSGGGFFESLIVFLRRVSRAVNGHDDDVAALKQRVTDLEAAAAALDARVTALETP